MYRWTDQEIMECIQDYQRRHPDVDVNSVDWGREFRNYQQRCVYKARREEIAKRRAENERAHFMAINATAAALLRRDGE